MQILYSVAVSRFWCEIFGHIIPQYLFYTLAEKCKEFRKCEENRSVLLRDVIMFCTTVYVELNFRDFGLTNWLVQTGNEEFVCEGHKKNTISCSEKDKNSPHHNIGLDRIQSSAWTSSLRMQGFSFQHNALVTWGHFCKVKD